MGLGTIELTIGLTSRVGCAGGNIKLDPNCSISSQLLWMDDDDD